MYFLTSLESIISFCLDYYILSYLLEYKAKRKYILIIASVYLCSYSFLSIYIKNETLFNLLAIITNLIICLILKTVFQKIRLRLIFKIHIFICSLDIIITSIILFLSNKIFTDSEIKTISFLANIIFTIFILCICLINVSSFRKMIYNTTAIVKNIIFLSLIISTFLLSFISGAPYFNNIKAWNITVRIVAVAFILIIGAVFPVMISNSISKSFYRKKSEMFEKQIQIQANYYIELAKSSHELQKFKHDFKNVSIGIKEFVKQNRIGEALEIIDKYNENLSYSPNTYKFSTGNEIVNALLSDKQKMAAISNTKVVFQGAIPDDFISPIDLCIILGNALDNAIEACEKISVKNEKIITFTFACSGGLAFITITNGEVKLLQMSVNASKENAIINMIPDVIDKITDFINNRKSDE